MKGLTIEFFGDELYRCVFSHSLVGGRRLAVRGRTPGAHANGAGTFQWTPAVQALCILLLREAAAARRTEHSPQLFAGGRLSPAASLAHALRKPPAWIFDLFGTAMNGSPIARRVFRSSVPRAHRSSLFCVSLTQRVLRGDDIVVFRDGAAVYGAEALEQLARVIEMNWNVGDEPRTRAPMYRAAAPDTHPLRIARPEQVPALFGSESLHREFCRRVSREVSAMMQSTDVFSRPGLSRIRHRLESDLSLRHILRFPDRALEQWVRLPDPAIRFGMTSAAKQLRVADALGRPLRVACAVGTPGAWMLFEHLRHRSEVPLDLDADFAYAIQILRRLELGRFRQAPDLVVLGSAPAAALMNSIPSLPYRPLMLLPAMSHRMLGSRRINGQERAATERGRLVMLHDDPSTSSFYFDGLVRTGKVKRGALSIEHGEPDDIPAAFAEGDPDLRAVSFFPFCDLVALGGEAQYIDRPQDYENMKDCVLFIHESLDETAAVTDALESLIRHAWITLRDDPSTLDQLVDQVFQSAETLQFLERSGGIRRREAVSSAQ